MTDKQFEQIEYLSKKLWGDINNGSDYSMVTYTEFLGIVTEVWEKLQEELASDDLEAAADKFVKSYTKGGTKQSWLKEGYIAGTKWQETKDESTTEDLGEYINELSKQFPEVSFAKLSRIAVRVAKWQKEQMLTKAIDGEIFEMEDAFKAGSKWKGNYELTWKDISGILNIIDVIANDDSMEERLKNMSEEEYCQEVLKRFKTNNRT